MTIEYVGFRAVDVLRSLFGKDWQRQGETVEFRALDGYVSRIAVSRFIEEKAFLVFARKDGKPFTVDNIAQNQEDVPLGPYYLVWDNVSSPALLKEGAGKWPYQVKEVKLVTLSDRALLPKGLEPRFRGGARLAKTHCLSCHKINGFGGEKFEGNLARIAKEMSRPEFIRWVLNPSSIRDGTTMPPLSDRLGRARAPADRERPVQVPGGGPGPAVGPAGLRPQAGNPARPQAGAMRRGTFLGVAPPAARQAATSAFARTSAS